MWNRSEVKQHGHGFVEGFLPFPNQLGQNLVSPVGARLWVGREHHVAFMELELVPDRRVSQAGGLLSLLLWQHARRKCNKLRHVDFYKPDKSLESPSWRRMATGYTLVERYRFGITTTAN